MHRKTNRIIAGIAALAMIIPATAVIAEPMKASAYELLGESDFEYKMLPWTPVAEYPAKQIFDIDEGAAHIKILVPSSGSHGSQWELQFRHRGLNFKANHEYKVCFKVKAAREGMELCSSIRSIDGRAQYAMLDGEKNDIHIGPEFDGKWGRPVELSTEYTEYSGTFTPPKDIEDAEWTFLYANDSDHFGGNAVEGDELWFDDMSIEDLTDTDYCPPVQNYGYTTRTFSGLENNFISVNQLGYYTGLSKKAVLGDNKGDIVHGAESINLTDSYDYEIVRVSDNDVVYTGKTDKPVKDDDSGDNVCKIDFSDFDEPGEYYIRIKGEEWRSFPFRIGSDIYSEPEHNMLTNALNYFYQNRSGIDISEKYITSGDTRKLAHRFNYSENKGYVRDGWYSDYMTPLNEIAENSSSSIDTSGGWFDGTDFDKSLTEGGISVWMLQNMYERAVKKDAGKDKFADGSGAVVIPETGNDYPDILDECRYELDFMSKMKVKPEEKTWGEYAGMYYHKLQGVGFKPIQLDYEHDYYSLYSVQPPSFTATLNYAACAAQGARLWAPYDAEYAAELLESAKEAYEAYKKNWYEASSDEENNPSSLYARRFDEIYHSSYSDTEIRDDAYWAACELYISAKEMNDKDTDSYFAEISGYDNAFSFSGVDNEIGDGSFTLFNWDNTGAAGSLSLMLHKELLSNEQTKALNESLLKVADTFIKTEESQGYSNPYINDEGYESDSNESAINNMIAMAYAYDLTGDAKYINGAAAGMDYILGNNPLSFSYITGYGSYHVKNPSHRYWQGEAEKLLPYAPDGVLASGPNSYFNDSYMLALGFKPDSSDFSSQRYYADSIESYSTNESSLSCNASLAWIISFLQDEANEVKASPKVYGDVNSDGEFSISDAVLLEKWLLGVPDTNLADWKAADLCEDGTLDVFDLCLLKKLLLKSDTLTD